MIQKPACNLNLLESESSISSVRLHSQLMHTHQGFRSFSYRQWGNSDTPALIHPEVFCLRWASRGGATPAGGGGLVFASSARPSGGDRPTVASHKAAAWSHVIPRCREPESRAESRGRGRSDVQRPGQQSRTTRTDAGRAWV